MDPLDYLWQILNSLLQLGLTGVFLISFLGSIIPFLPLPYLAIVVILSQEYSNIDLIFLGLSAGIGGGIGKLTTYFIGRALNLKLSEKKKAELKIFSSLIKKYGTLGVFIFALTPLPDDVLYFPLGLAKFSFLRFFIPNLIGKTILAIFVAMLGHYYFEIAKNFFGESESILINLIAISFMIIITIFLLKIKWSKVYEIVQKEGICGLIKQWRNII